MPAAAKRALDKDARRMARRVGMRAHKSDRPFGPDNHGGYALVDDLSDVILIGHGFVLTAGEVIDYCSSVMN